MFPGSNNVGRPMRRILHVEDSLTVAACVRGFLRERGYQVEYAANGREAPRRTWRSRRVMTPTSSMALSTNSQRKMP